MHVSTASDVDDSSGFAFEIEDLYPLSPLQQGLLFHTLENPESLLYVAQFSYRIAHAFNVPAFEQAWRTAISRHTALRSSFIWEEIDQPIQVVYREVPVAIEQRDLSRLAPDRQAAAIASFLQEDEQRGFVFDQPPLVRLTLLRLGPGLWQFVFTHHHLLLDGWSYALLLKEVAAHYAAARANTTVDLPPARPFRDYIAWLQDQDSGRSERFWRAALSGFERATPLPGGIPAEARLSRKRQRSERRISLSAASTSTLRSVAAQRQVTLNSLVQGAWAVVLSLYSGERDVVFGCTVSGRPPELPDSASMVGLFINTLPIRVKLPAGAPVIEWIRAIQRFQADAQQFEFVNLAELQGWSDVPRSMPLFESILSFQNYPLNAFEDAQRESVDSAAPSFDFHVQEVRSIENSHYAINLVVAPGAELELKLLIDASQIDPEFAGPILDRMAAALEEIVSAPDRALGAMPLITQRERDDVLVNWRPAGVLEHSPVDALFAAQAAAFPESAALAFGSLSIGYGELERRANQLARFLSQLGAAPETPVGLCFQRGPEMVIAALAVLKAGCAYVPLDPDLPFARLAFLIEDCRIPLVLTTRESAQKVPSSWSQVVALEEHADAIAALDASPLASSNSPESAAYVMYTSGSSGAPKGVVVPHRAIERLVRGPNYLDIRRDDVFLQYAPFSFDASTFEIWGALLNGARLVITEPRRASVEELAGLIEQAGVTILWLTSGVFQQMVDQCLERLHGVRALLAGGDVLPLAQVRKMRERWPGRLINGYGPTENTTFTACHAVAAEESFPAGVPIGKPVSGTQVYVVDAEGRLLPPGAIGELYIGGSGLSRGYLGHPAMTAERFTPDTFSGEAGARLYRSGDRARWRVDGTLECFGRGDGQVKLRGYRIELGEVDAAIARSPGVLQAASAIHVEPGGERVLAAYIVPAPGGIGLDELRARLRSELPEYMVPSAFVLLDTLPLTPNGKIDRRALPEPRAAALEHVSAEPRTPVEEIVAGVWAEVLKQPRVGRLDNFFDLGGHSLLATQVISRLRAAFDVEIPMRVLFETPTVAAFAEAVEQARGTAPGDARPLARSKADDPARLSFAQQRMWFVDQIAPGQAAYNCPAAVRLAGVPHLAALSASLAEIIRRHEVLRTRILTVGVEPVQVIDPAGNPRLSVVDLQALPDAVRGVAMARIAAAEARRPFDLARGPLLRAFLVHLREDEYTLLETLHHIVTDGWSFSLLIKEFSTLYEAFARGEPSPLPEPALQYRDFAVWQREWLQGAALEAQLAYWREQLAGMPSLELPTDRPRPAAPANVSGLEHFYLDGVLMEQLRRLSRREGASLFMTLLAAYQFALGYWCGQRDVPVGTDVANRNRVETEELVGFFVNQLVLRTDVGGEGTYLDLLGRVRRTVLDAYAHQDVPFERIVEELAPGRSLAKSPLFQVKLVLQNMPGATYPKPALGMAIDPVRYPVANFDLTLTLEETGAALGGVFTYRSELFEPGAIVWLKEQIEYILREVAQDAEAPLARLREGLDRLRGERRVRLEAELADAMRRRLASKPRPEAQPEAAAGSPKNGSRQEGALRIGRRQPVSVSDRSLVKEAAFVPGQLLPLVMTPGAEAVDLAVWLANHRQHVQERLLLHGAVLFRNFGVKSSETFQAVVNAMAESMSYTERSSPRTQVSNRLYTSTDYPADQSIFPHNEHSYNLTFPLKLFFWCELASETGGSTPLADTRKIYRRIPERIRDPFERKGWMFVRNFNTGFGLPWQTVFQTGDRAQVEEYCRGAGIEWEWREEGRLRTRQVRPAVGRHPGTGEAVWFNHATFFHVTTLKASITASLRAEFSEFEMPNNTFYGDGSPIPDEVVQQLREAYLAEQVSFKWRPSDVIVLDNMLTSHARDPYTGPRRILFAMAEPHTRNLAQELSAFNCSLEKT